MAKLAPVYSGPQCPRCGVTLAEDVIRTGTITCLTCTREFTATAFQPPRRTPRLAQAVVGAGPEGANACATHPGNAAVTSCGRCGLFICSLCEMNVGSGAFCPACFDRVRAEGTLPDVTTHHRDYASLARLAIAGGIVIWFLAPLFGGLSLYFTGKAFKQRREEGRSRFGVVVAGLIALVQVAGSLLFFGILIWSLFRSGKAPS